MAKRRFELSKIEADGQPEEPFDRRAFLQNVQTALLLALLEKNLLTQRQFDRCLEELQKQDVKS